MRPRCWLPRKSWRLEHNQCRDPFYFCLRPPPPVSDNRQRLVSGMKLFPLPEYHVCAMEITRRSFVALSATLPFATHAFAKKSPIPIGLELYSVREALKQDPEGTVRAVAALGYQCVEFYAPYFEWTEAQARSMRKLLDELGIRCYSTHNDQKSFSPENISRARDLNLALGTKYVVMAYSEPKGSPDGWKAIADQLL